MNSGKRRQRKVSGTDSVKEEELVPWPSASTTPLPVEWYGAEEEVGVEEDALFLRYLNAFLTSPVSEKKTIDSVRLNSAVF